jgi:hypothetical protein
MPVDADTRVWLVEQGRLWSRAEREAHRPQALPLPDAARQELAPFFPPATLEQARYRWVDAIANPPFREEALARGVPYKLDFTQSAGLTHNDTFLINRARVPEDTAPPVLLLLLFHELVHVVQYDVLGVDDFVRQYVEGYLDSGDYFAIPLELGAFALQAVAAMGIRFSVEDLVRRTVGLRRAALLESPSADAYLKEN